MMRCLQETARCALIAITMFMVPYWPALAAPAGTVVGLAGGCTIESGGTRNPLKLGQAVEAGDTVETAADGKLKVRMADGSVLAIGAATRLTIAAYTTDNAGHRQDALLSLPQGVLRAIVAPVAPSEQPARFEVQTAVGSAAVRSTDWLVAATANDMQVRVISGSVALTSAGTKRSELIRARWGSRIEAGRDPLPPQILPRTEFNSWIARTRVAAGQALPHGLPRQHPGGRERVRGEERRYHDDGRSPPRHGKPRAEPHQGEPGGPREHEAQSPRHGK